MPSAIHKYGYVPDRLFSGLSLLLAIAVLAVWGLPCGALAATETPGSESAPDEEAAVFEEREAGFDSADADPAVARDSASDTGPLFYTNHFNPPQMLSHREKRSISQTPWLRIFPFIIVLTMAAVLCFAGRKETARPAASKLKVSRLILLLLCVLPAVFLVVEICSALVMNTAKDTVVGFLGGDKKIYQRHIKLTDEHVKRFQNQLEWAPSGSAFKVYYSKSNGRDADAFVFILEDKLKICGGLHKYGIKVTAKGDVAGVQVMELTCDRSYCINSKAFLRQFKSFNAANATARAKTYDAISGATLSTDLTLNIVRRALLLYEIMQERVHG